MRVPTYQDRQSAQVVNQPRARDVSSFPAIRQLGIAVQDLGSLLAQRKMIQNEADGANAYNAFSIEDIQYRTELKQRQGIEARNLTSDYSGWFKKKTQEIREKYAHSPDVEAIFQRYADKHYRSKIGTLAAYEAAQNKEYNQSVLNTDLQNIEAEVTSEPYATIETEDGEVLAIEDRIKAYHQKAAILMGGAYTQDVAGDIEAKIKTNALTAMITQDPSKVGPVLDKWKVDIGAKAHAQFKETAKKQIIEKQVDTVYDVARNMDVLDAEDYINASGLPTDERRKLIRNVRADHDREQKETEKQQKEIVEQNNLDALESYFNGTLKERDLDTLAQGQQVSEGIYKYIKNEITEDAKVTENDPIRVGEISEKIELKDYSGAQDLLVEALQGRHIKIETYLTMVKSLTSDMVSDAIGYINRAMQPSELEFDPFKRQKHADALVDLTNRMASGESPIEAARNIVRLNRSMTSKMLSRYPRPRFLEGDKDNTVHLADAEFKTVEAFKNGTISDAEYRTEIERIQSIKDALAESMRNKESEDSANDALRGIKVGR